jgi:predicted transcriptional regulator
MTTSAKKAALDLIESLPEDASFEDIMYELYFREHVDQGLEEARRGDDLVPHEEVVRNVSEWLMSAGHG